MTGRYGTAAQLLAQPQSSRLSEMSPLLAGGMSQQQKRASLIPQETLPC